MVRITEELVRKKSEHNECVINTLEELSLHQEDVERIEHLQNWCKNIQILYLQNNLIAKIENLNKLKNLQYLNLAINNIEKVENLERCESLEKLDLTLNFIGDIESILSLGKNLYLRDLYLTGNPCCDYPEYRNYIVAKLPQLRALDGKEITRSERIKATQMINRIQDQVQTAQQNYMTFRHEQRERLKQTKDHLDDDTFWKSTSENAPETRNEISKRSRRNKETAENDDDRSATQRSVSLYAKDGRPLNVNQAKLQIRLHDDDPKELVLEVAVYKHLDTDFIDVDVQPILVRVKVKSKVIQYVLPEEVHPDKSSASRSQTTGHLVVRMPRVDFKEKLFGQNEKLTKKSEFLEVQNEQESMDFSKICSGTGKQFQDNPQVPPLEYY